MAEGAFALMIAVPTAAVMGTPILDDLYRKPSSSLAISLYAIAVNAVILPLAIVILEWATRPRDQDQAFGTVLRRVLITTASRSIVWSPFVALALVAVGFEPPHPFDASLDLVGEATSAVALFASGLIIARFRVSFGVEPIALAIIKNIAQPAAMVGIAAVLGITGVARSEAVILTAMPASVVGPMFAVRYGSYQSEAASTLITTNRPTQDWGVFLGDVPAATAILDRFLAHATIVQMTGKSYRLRGRTGGADD